MPNLGAKHFTGTIEPTEADVTKFEVVSDDSNAVTKAAEAVGKAHADKNEAKIVREMAAAESRQTESARH